MTRWYERSFEGLKQGDVVEFFRHNVDPNTDENADSKWERPVTIHEDARPPKENEGAPEGLVTRAGEYAYLVRSDEWQPWTRAQRR